MTDTVKLRYIVTDEGTIKVLDRAGKELGELEQATERASRAGVSGFGRMNGVAANLSKTLGTLGVAVAGLRLAGIVRESLDTVDSMTKLARSVGVSAGELSSFRVTAELSGTSIERLGRGLGVLSQRMAEAAAGGGAARGIFRALDIDLHELDGSLRSPADALVDFADRFEQLGTSTERTAAAQAVWGNRLALELIPALAQGSQAIAEQRAQAELFGLAIDEDMGRRVEAANDSLTLLRLTATGVTQGLAVALAPTIESVATSTLVWVEANREVIDSDLPAFLQNVSNILELMAPLASLVASSINAIGRGAGVLNLALKGSPIESEGRAERDARLAVEGRIDAARERISARAGTVDLAALREAFNASASTDAGSSTLKDNIRGVRSEIDKLQSSLETLDPIAEKTSEALTRTLSLDLGQSFRRLTTGGGDFDIGEGFKNALGAAAADGFDAFFGEKLKFDFEVQRNFAEDLPSFFEDGMSKIVGIFRGTTGELQSEAQRSAQGISREFGAGFGDVASAGQGLSSTLDALDLQAFNRVGAGRSVGVATDPTFGQRFSGPGAGAFANQFGAPVDPAAGGGNGFAGAAGLGAAALIGLAPLIEDALRPSGVVDAGRFGARSTINEPEFGFADATATVGAFGYLVGGPVGGIVGGVVGALVGLLIEEFASSVKSQGDIGGEIINEIAAKDSLIIQQQYVTGNGRTGIDADFIDRTPGQRVEFFTDQGFANDIPNLRPSDRLFDRIVSDILNPERAHERRVLLPNGKTQIVPAGHVLVRPGRAGPGPNDTFLDFAPPSREAFDQANETGLAVGALLGEGNASFTLSQANRVSNNLLLSQIEFPEEIKRQGKKLAEAAGFDLFSGIEQLAANFTQRGNNGAFPADFTREQFAASVEKVVELFSDDIPAGLDVTALAMEHLGERSVNTGVLLEELGRQVEILGELETGLGNGLRAGVAAGLTERSPEQVFAVTGSITETTKAVARRGSAFTSAIQTGIRDSVTTAITEGVFDTIQASPAWEALNNQVAESVRSGVGFADIPGLAATLISDSVPVIEAAQQSTQGILDAFNVTPTTLYGRADSIGDRVDSFRFGRLTPEGQRDQLLNEREGIGDQIFGILEGGVTDKEKPLLADLYERLGGNALDTAGLADQLFNTETLTGARKADAFVNEHLGVAERAEAGLNNLGNLQNSMDATAAATEANTTALSRTSESTIQLVTATDHLALVVATNSGRLEELTEAVTRVANGAALTPGANR